MAKVTTYTSRPLQSFQLPHRRFGHVHIDILGLLKPSQAFQYLLICIDNFTRWPEANPVADVCAETIKSLCCKLDLTIFESLQ